jgi:FHA domain-containing protein
MSSLPRFSLTVAKSNDGEFSKKNYYDISLSKNKNISIGRSSTNDIMLEDAARIISRVQAELSVRDSVSVNVANLSASTSIYINTFELKPYSSCILQLTDSLMIGDYVIKLTIDEIDLESIEEKLAVDIYSLKPTANLIPEDADIFFDCQISDEILSHAPLQGDIDSLSIDASLNALIKGTNDLPLLDSEGELIVGSTKDRSLLDLSTSVSGAASSSVGVAQNLNYGLEVESLFITPVPVTSKTDKHSEKNNQQKVEQHILSSRIDEKIDAPLELACRQAFSRGLQIDLEKVPMLTPGLFEQLGVVLLHLTAGTVNLMHERAQIKHEMRADVTIIASSGNNPLKFAPDAQSAITHLLGEPMTGFLRAKDAIDDAFDDLLAHQVGLLSGARESVYEVVRNFSPEKIQKYLTVKNVIDSLFPISKKSKLWELYETHYGEVAGSAREDFELRFQRAFAHAYEQEIDRISEARELE